MPATAHPAAPALRWLRDIPHEPWPNGAGRTQPLAADAAHQPPHWRISLAEVPAAVAFSCLPQTDRLSLLAEGGPLVLQTPQGPATLAHWGEALAYDGLGPLATAPTSQPARLLNLFTRRGHHTARAGAWQGEGPQSLAGGCAVVVLVLHGACTARVPGQAPLRLRAGQVLTSQATLALAAADPAQPRCRVLWAAIDPAPEPGTLVAPPLSTTTV